jgi:hypothetical protein
MTIRYWLDCPCGQRLAVDTTQAGESVRCVCGADLQVPALREMSCLETAVTNKAPNARQGKHFWGKRQSRIFLATFITVGAVGALLLLELMRPRLVDVELLPPVQVWTMWQDLRRGPDRNLAAAEQQIIDSQGVFRAGEMIMAVCAAAGILLMVVGYAMPGPRPSRGL